METSSFPPPTQPMIMEGEPGVVELRREPAHVGTPILVGLIVLAAYVLVVGNQKIADWMFRRDWTGSASTARQIVLFPAWRFNPPHDSAGFWMGQIIRDVVLIGLTLLLAWAVLRRVRPLTFGITWLVGAMATTSAAVVAAVLGQLTVRVLQDNGDLLARPSGELAFLLQTTGVASSFGLAMGVVIGFAMAVAATFSRPAFREPVPVSL